MTLYTVVYRGIKLLQHAMKVVEFLSTESVCDGNLKSTKFSVLLTPPITNFTGPTVTVTAVQPVQLHAM